VQIFKGKGVNSGLRLVYAHFKDQNIETENSNVIPADDEKTNYEIIDKEKIVFIELYHKSDKENEDRERILNNFK